MTPPPITRPTIPHVPVLIVGAGLAGLSAAALLAWRGVPCLLVERRASTTRHPRARGVNPRSMELLRSIPGLEADLAAAGRAGTGDLSIVIAESVTGREFRTLAAPGTFDTRRLSPAATCTAGQDRVEPILLRHARALGAEIRFSTELAGFTQDARGVHATLRNTETGASTFVAADYMIAADGNRSPARNALGIGVHGHGTISHNMSILFDADLSAALRGRGFVLYYLQNPHFTGVFVSTDDPNCGQVSVEYDPARESAADYDAAHAAEIVRAALGLPKLDVDVVDVMPWEMSSQVADRMAVGRVFLAGDAAHTMPPTGGLGGQTAIQDAADLVWKLALVLQNRAGSALLDTYAAERHPVAELTVAWQMANYVERLRPDRTDLPATGAETDYLSVAMGYRYRSAGIQDDALDDAETTEDPLNSTGRAGTRVAHVPLTRDGREVSTLDLTGRGFVLFAGPDGSEWTGEARILATQHGLPLVAFTIGADLAGDPNALLARTGLGADGALLVRPDGFIAWRSRRAVGDPRRVLEAVLGRVLCRDLAASSRERAA
jgi:2-polyprenyl-6-methoxyphenol hydroxylase-like FAD-dependent oxidoreductase